jgi:hypothetical protein
VPCYCGLILIHPYAMRTMPTFESASMHKATSTCKCKHVGNTTWSPDALQLSKQAHTLRSCKLCWPVWLAPRHPLLQSHRCTATVPAGKHTNLDHRNSDASYGDPSCWHPQIQLYRLCGCGTHLSVCLPRWVQRLHELPCEQQPHQPAHQPGLAVPEPQLKEVLYDLHSHTTSPRVRF